MKYKNFRPESRKLAMLHAVCVAMATLFAALLVYDTGVIKGLNQAADAERLKYRQAAALKSTVEGEIVDRFGNAITEPSQPGAAGRVVSPAFSHIVGYKSPIYGLSGLRSRYRDVLYDGGEDAKGRTLQLTLDSALQLECYRLLDGQEGAIVVIDADDGQVLAAASRSSAEMEYDVNKIDDMYETYAQQNAFWYDRCTMGGDAPGSTMKVVTSAALLREKMQDFVYDDSEGAFHINGGIIHNYGGAKYGPEVNIQKALSKSSNTFFAAAGVALGVNAMDAAMTDFGLNQVISCDWADLVSEHHFKSSLDQAELAQVSFGQGTLTVTPVNVAMMMMPVISKNSTLMKPSMVRGTQKDENQPLQLDAPFKGEVFSEPLTHGQAETLRELLHQTALDHGFNENDYGYVCSKTGTAQTSRKGFNHIYYLVGMRDVGRNHRNLAFVVSRNNSTHTSSALSKTAKALARYLAVN